MITTLFNRNDLLDNRPDGFVIVLRWQFAGHSLAGTNAGLKLLLVQMSG